MVTTPFPLPEPPLAYRPLTMELWPDLQRLFGPAGAYGGCWCMWWWLPRQRHAEQLGEGNRQAMIDLLRQGGRPGILLYDGAEPVGWCAVAPRNRLQIRLRGVAESADPFLWSIVCCFVRAERRRQGLSSELIRCAVHHVATHGGHTVEAYPVIPFSDDVLPVALQMGVSREFAAAGFREIARLGARRLLMRRPVASAS